MSFFQTHLTNRNGTYYFRMRIPVDLLAAYAPKKELMFSLKTKDVKAAKELCRLEAVRLDQEFTTKRRELDEASSLQQAACTARHEPTPTTPAFIPFEQVTPPEINRLILLYAREAIKLDERITTEETAAARQEWDEHQALMKELHTTKGLYFEAEPFPETQGLSLATVDKKRQRAYQFVNAAPSFLARRDYGPIQHTAELYLKSHGIQPPEPEEQAHSFRFKEFCLSIMKEEFRVQTCVLRRLNGDWTAELPALIVAEQERPQAVTMAAQAALVVSPENPRFTDVWKSYLAERKPAPATIRNFEPAIRRFTELVGNLPIKAITKSHIRQLKEALLKMPVHMRKELNSLSLPKILKKIEKMGDYALLNSSTINNKYLAVISAICSHAIANGFIDVNPCADIRATAKRAIGEAPAVLPYSAEDLHIIFQKSALFKLHSNDILGVLPSRTSLDRIHEYRWLVLLALFTGARLEELGQLDLTDVKEEAGVKYIHIHGDTDTGRTVKNRASRRKTPLHPRLLELGFMDFVQAGKNAGAKKLFASFPVSSIGKRTNAFSRWWERFTTQLGIKGADKKKRFHSFRHCFKREMVNTMNVSEKLIDALQGHTVQGVSAQYGRDEDGMQYALPVLFEAISKATFNNVTEGLEALMKPNKN